MAGDRIPLGLLLRNLDWIHGLNIRYDASTFDTDPFEPQPDAAGTIFPFFCHNGSGNSYAELPYTLAQDSTLFLVLEEETAAIWLQKLEWIVEHGGMALVNVHPDYLSFDGHTSSSEFPVERYSELLEEINNRYQSKAWCALPGQVAKFMDTNRNCIPIRNNRVNDSGGEKRKIWIDLENTPHIPFFNPIMKELKSRGYEIVLTARDAYQTCEMGIYMVSATSGSDITTAKISLRKSGDYLLRSFQLIPFARREKPDLSLNHGSRTREHHLKDIGNSNHLDYGLRTYIGSRNHEVTLVDYSRTCRGEGRADSTVFGNQGGCIRA